MTVLAVVFGTTILDGFVSSFFFAGIMVGGGAVFSTFVFLIGVTVFCGVGAAAFDLETATVAGFGEGTFCATFTGATTAAILGAGAAAFGAGLATSFFKGTTFLLAGAGVAAFDFTAACLVADLRAVAVTFFATTGVGFTAFLAAGLVAAIVMLLF